MNILHIISAPASGGAEVYVKDLAKTLSDRGHKLYIVFVNHALEVQRDAKYEQSFLKDLCKYNISYMFLGNRLKKNPILASIKLKKYIKRHSIDICHAHLTYGVLFSILLRIPIVFTQHSIKPRLNRSFYPIFNKLITQYVGISQICSDSLVGYTGREVFTINNGVSPEKFKDLNRYRSLPDDKIIIAMVGRFVIQKDYLNALTALTLLNNNDLNKIKLRIAGEGEKTYIEQVRDFILNNNLQNYVELVGVENNISKFLYDADIFLMSSSSEGLPIALIEATFSGLPCIVTDVGGCSEVIKNCENGLVVPPSNPGALANNISKLINDRNLFSNFSNNAIENSNYYSIERSAAKHEELYSNILQRS